MSSELWLAYCGYLIWLLAGFADFVCHRRTDLPYTSGVAESTTHLLELGLLGVAVVLTLAFEVGPSIMLLILALVVAHAIVGYVDSRIAFARRRVVLPVEQHIHSVLDSAPIIGFAWIVISTWPAATSASWQPELRHPALSAGIWLAVVAPPVLLCAVPAILEFRMAWRARRSAAT